MAVSVERLKEYAKAGQAGGCTGVCGACPLAASCRPLTVEFGKNVLNVNNLTEVPAEFKGIITFNPVSQGNGEPPTIRTSEKTCSECNKPASTCPHSETLDI